MGRLKVHLKREEMEEPDKYKYLELIPSEDAGVGEETK